MNSTSAVRTCGGPTVGADWRASPTSVKRPRPARCALPCGNTGLDGSQEAGNLDLYVKSPGFPFLAQILKRILISQTEHACVLSAPWRPPVAISCPEPQRTSTEMRMQLKICSWKAGPVSCLPACLPQEKIGGGKGRREGCAVEAKINRWQKGKL